MCGQPISVMIRTKWKSIDANSVASAGGALEGQSPDSPVGKSRTLLLYKQHPPSLAFRLKRFHEEHKLRQLGFGHLFYIFFHAMHL